MKKNLKMYHKSNFKILVVEDDVVQRNYMRSFLCTNGFTSVTAVERAEECLVLLRDGVKFDMVICDIKLPDMDGVELLTYLDEFDLEHVIIVSSIDEDVLKVVEKICRKLEFGSHAVFRKVDVNSKLIEYINSKLEFSTNENVIIETKSSYSHEEIISLYYDCSIVNFYQPQFDVEKNQVVSFEILTRLVDKKGDYILPGDFIPIVKLNGYIFSLMLTSLEQAFIDFREFNIQKSLSLNVTQEILRNKTLYSHLVQLCDKYNFKYQDLTLEITEEEMYEDSVSMLSNLSRLAIKGFRLSIDDFGTGFASLDKVLDLPISELKVDKSIVRDITYSQKKTEVVSLLVALATALNIKLITEGVEDYQTLDILKELGVRHFQGFYFGRPMPITFINGQLSESE
ncbi:EAL domain-containing response regulator [Vibrio sp. CyArs1]|uniref:EAL domain-containing response regulator n=1 Tax=Vibrio sp. CyArs1 TaxID=2682577 RepID=UPI001F063F00|nr:EAL domain-containing response regulator [Vibrio sp. CyArs1]